MRPNRSSGRYRHYIRVLERSGGKNEYGEPEDFSEVFDTRCNVQVKSGKELAAMGIPVTSETITVLTRFDPRLSEKQFIEWVDSIYRISHIKPDEHDFECVITAEIEKDV